MRRFTLILLYFVIMLPVFSQSNIRLNDFWSNTYYINPGSINDDYHAAFSLAARKQWLGFPGSPNTIFAAGTLYTEKIQTQYGLKVYADQIGYNTITNFSLSYSYSAYLNRQWQLNMGISAAFQSLSYDKSEVSMMTADDPALYENMLQENNYNADAGVELIGKSWRFGVSSLNLLTIFYDENLQQINTSYLYAIYHKKTENPIELEYGVCGVKYDDFYQMECNITTYFKLGQESDVFHAGLFYRTQSEMGVLLGCNLTESIRLGYSYDFNVSGISRSSIGTHELLLSYSMNKIKFKKYRY